VELTPIGVRDATEIERGILGFATRTGPDGGLITVGPDTLLALADEVIE
jgi:hypothetical protein